jgi:hypothetical protein
VAKTARLRRAKRLLDDTNLRMTEVAVQAGSSSVRRFNAVFAEVYRQSPSEIRRRARNETSSRHGGDGVYRCRRKLRIILRKAGSRTILKASVRENQRASRSFFSGHPLFWRFTSRGNTRTSQATTAPLFSLFS